MNLKGKTSAFETFSILASCQKNIEPNQIYNANSFNDFFIKIDSNLTKHLKKNLRPRLKSNAHSLFLYKTILSEIQKIFQGLDNKSSSGDDNLINVLFKTSVSVTAVYLEYIINFSFSTIVFPNALSNANVVPLHEECSKLDENNLRQLSPLNVWSKIFESVI